MKVIAIVPARSGSKGLPDKNIKQIKGRTLIEWAVDVAIRSNSIHEVYISTDSAKYEQIGVSAGAKSLGLRSAALSSDRAKSADVVIDLLNTLKEKKEEFDLVVLLQPTSPIRSAEEIDECVRLMEKEAKFNSVVSVSKFEEPHPHKLKCISEEGFLVPYIQGASSEIPRQELPTVYNLTGAIYVVKVQKLIEERSFFVPPTMPFVTNPRVNIDSQEDFDYLSYLVENEKIMEHGK